MRDTYRIKRLFCLEGTSFPFHALPCFSRRQSAVVLMSPSRHMQPSFLMSPFYADNRFALLPAPSSTPSQPRPDTNRARTFSLFLSVAAPSCNLPRACFLLFSRFCSAALPLTVRAPSPVSFRRSAVLPPTTRCAFYLFLTVAATH